MVATMTLRLPFTRGLSTVKRAVAGIKPDQSALCPRAIPIAGKMLCPLASRLTLEQLPWENIPSPRVTITTCLPRVSTVAPPSRLLGGDAISRPHSSPVRREVRTRHPPPPHVSSFWYFTRRAPPAFVSGINTTTSGSTISERIAPAKFGSRKGYLFGERARTRGYPERQVGLGPAPDERERSLHGATIGKRDMPGDRGTGRRHYRAAKARLTTGDELGRAGP